MVESSPAEAERLLTPRQLEVLELMAKGLSNAEIAGVLEISAATVKTHVSAVIAALDVTNRTEAATRLHELGLGDSDVAPRSEFSVEGFGSRPAIAVLPFDDFSSESERDFLADGISEDLITRLAGWRWFPVIARNSTFVYRGRSVDVREVSRDLGARYVVEGSVRRAGERLRITVQLIDGESAQHVWAERYDRDLAEIFDVTDEIIDSVVSTLAPAIAKIEGMRVRARPPEDLDALEIVEKAWLHALENSVEGLLAAQALVDRALDRDPHQAVGLAQTLYLQFNLSMLGLDDGTAPPEVRIERAARTLVDLDRSDPFGPMGFAILHVIRREPGPALEQVERSVELGPSLVWPRFIRAMSLLAAGRYEESRLELVRAIRLSPQDPLLAVIEMTLGACLIRLVRFDEAAEHLRRAIREGPQLPYAYPWLAVCLQTRGEAEEARALVERMREVAPGYSPFRGARAYGPPSEDELVRDALAIVGLTE